jgi:predicted anti-sigma-YlaC factor YlaD
MLSCKDVTHLLSEGLDRKLSLGERVQMEMHLAMCKGCSNFRKQMDFLRTACRRYADSIGRDEDRSR